ncbi:phage tail protein I [Pseudochelatococcus sp. G4_1912]|uniref:phage tail protein I n=1 Tax=Pseudochelatococcus sp. G4_1912 TaxID=3114288 RepID=UPI0039C6D643
MTLSYDTGPQRSFVPAASDYEQVLSEAFAAAFAGQPDGWGITDVLSPARCPPVLLPWLAWEWSVDEWQRDWSEAVQRAVIAGSWDLHSIKGSAGAMQRAVNALGFSLNVVEWWQATPERDPYTYRYSLTSPFGRSWTEAEIVSMERVSRRAKNVRSWLEAIELKVSGAKVPVYAGAVIHTRLRVAPGTEPVTQLTGTASAFSGAVIASRLRVSITVS